MPPQGPYHDLWVPVENVLCALSSYALERCSSEACVRIQSVADLLIMQRCRYV
ncbi:hypothetical protein KXX33_006659 [Aspergillus fumigatus]|nr:hypothetical protein KXX33_006659 [Aspergillus fumigatus]KAH1372832.1 hypothetical protein KXX50_003234 [Aspergillus fumigatus]KAH1747431.1 hypothetical protein KXX56_002986 [Aspergillus fumigatus]KAH1773117.1 hypothetical protein KXX62_000961 [Aspergillus fumigatus]KAH1792059.1 hypothetical protein KXX36_004181 [Aspergillus fumigatus]